MLRNPALCGPDIMSFVDQFPPSSKVLKGIEGALLSMLNGLSAAEEGNTQLVFDSRESDTQIMLDVCESGDAVKLG